MVGWVRFVLLCCREWVQLVGVSRWAAPYERPLQQNGNPQW